MESEVRAALGWFLLSLRGVVLTLAHVRTELNCNTPTWGETEKSEEHDEQHHRDVMVKYCCGKLHRTSDPVSSENKFLGGKKRDKEGNL